MTTLPWKKSSRSSSCVSTSPSPNTPPQLTSLPPSHSSSSSLTRAWCRAMTNCSTTRKRRNRTHSRPLPIRYSTIHHSLHSTMFAVCDCIIDCMVLRCLLSGTSCLCLCLCGVNSLHFVLEKTNNHEDKTVG